MQSRLHVYDDQWQRGLRLWLVYVAITILVGVMDWVGWLPLPRKILERITSSLQRPASVMHQGIIGPITWIKLGRNPSQRIADLESRLATAAVDQARLQQLEAKVTEMEVMLQSQPSGKRADHIVELVTFDDREVWIAAGSQEVTTGQLVLDSHGVLIGKVGETGHYTSRIILPGATEYRIAVQTVSGSAKGVIERQGAQITLTSVLQTEELHEGDILVTSAVSDNVLPKVVVAQVTKLIGNPSDPTKGAEIALLADLKGWASVW